MIIDVHSHIVPSGVRRAAATDQNWHGISVRADDDGGLRFTVGDHSGRLPWKNFRHTPEDRIADMDRFGVDMQLLSMSPALWQFRADPADALAGAREFNDEIADLCRRWPTRFGGLAWLPLQDASASVEELGRAVTELGLAGVSVATHVNGENWDAERLFPIMRAAEELGALVFIHPAQVRVRDLIPKFHLRNMIGNPWETTAAASSLVLGGVLDRLPELKVALAHGGGFTAMAMGRLDHGYDVRPEAKEFIERVPSDYLRRMYYDTITHSESALAFLADSVGVDRLVVGSDYPADMGPSSPVGWVQSIDRFTAAEKAMILSGNVSRLLGTAEPAGATP